MGLSNTSNSDENDIDNNQNKNSQTHGCSTKNTEVIVELLKTPKDKRDEQWREIFFENIIYAGFSESLPQVIYGKDSFPYFVLKTDEHFNPFESYCIGRIKDNILLKHGIGVVINPEKGTGEWMFSYGEILNLQLNHEFISRQLNTNSGGLTENVESILNVSQPTENYLPEFSRNVIRFFLINNGIKKPKVMMLTKTNGVDSYIELAFNIYAEDFSSTEKMNLLLNRLKWFLPRHYLISSIPKKSEMAKEFVLL